MKKGKFLILAGMSAAALIFGLALTGCGGNDDDSTTNTVSTQLEYDNLSKLAFLGGSLMYNPDRAVGGQVVKGAKIATRLSTLSINQAAANPDEKYKETAHYFGYITIDDVNTQSVTVTYTEYNADGISNIRGPFKMEVGGDDSADINGDGVDDLVFAPPGYKRNGMENAIYLTFLSMLNGERGTVGMYSVIPENYARAAFPNGVMGVNPQGQLIVTAYDKSGARAAVRGAEYGDIVVDTHEADKARYGYIKNGAAFRSAARAGDFGTEIQEVEFDGDWTSQSRLPSRARSAAAINRTGLADTDDSDIIPVIPEDASQFVNEPYSGDNNANEAASEESVPPYFTDDQFNNYATPDELLARLPASLTTAASGSTTIDKLNAVLAENFADIIEAVLGDGRNQFTDEFKNLAAQLKTESFTTEYEKISASRSFLAEAFAENCPVAAASSVPEMFPLMSVSFSNGDPGAVVGASILAAQQSFDYINAGARAAQSGYTNYVNNKTQIINQFNSQYKKIKEVNFLEIIKKKKPSVGEKIENSFDTVNLSLTIGLYGSLTNYWGKIELGVGAAVLVNAEADTPKVEYKNYDEQKGTCELSAGDTVFNAGITVGPVYLDVGVYAEVGMMINAAVRGNIFAGFIGLYGGRAWVGADYGIGWNYKKVWFIKIWYPAPYFNTYSKSDKVATQAYYFGTKDTSAAAITGTLVMTPYITLSPKLTLWKSIWGQIDCTAKTPGTLTLTAVPSFHGNLKFDLGLDIYAQAGLTFDFQIYKYSKNFGRWQVYTWSTNLYNKQIF